MKVIALFGVIAIALSSNLSSAQEMTDSAIKERIKPVGSVHVSGSSAEAGVAAARSGQDIYNTACVACHGSGILGAPRLNNANDWQPRIDERGFDGVWQNAINGYNAMPPRGTCANCSDEEIRAAVKYMTKEI